MLRVSKLLPFFGSRAYSRAKAPSSEMKQRPTEPKGIGSRIPLGYSTMGMIYLLAQQVPSIWSPGNIMVALLTMASAFAIVGGLAALLARGFWSKTIEPMIQAAVFAWYSSEDQLKVRVTMVEQSVKAWSGSQEQIDARAKEINRVVTGWHTSPEQLKIRKEFVRDEIDHHVRRDDGLIHMEIKASVQRGVQPLHADMAEIKFLLQSRTHDELVFREQVIGKLAHLEGLVSSHSPGHTTLHSPIHAETPLHPVTRARSLTPAPPPPSPPPSPPRGVRG